MMNTLKKILKVLPSVLLRVAHLIKHLFCDIDTCNVKEDDSE